MAREGGEMSDNFWTVFKDTGDVLCYLLWKADCRTEKNTDRGKGIS